MARHARIVKSKNEYDLDDHMHDYDPISMAVPDQSLGIREIIRRYENGTMPLGSMHQGYYDSEPLYDDIDAENFDFTVSPENEQNFDLTDLDEYGKEMQELRTRMRASQELKNVGNEPKQEEEPGE